MCDLEPLHLKNPVLVELQVCVSLFHKWQSVVLAGVLQHAGCHFIFCAKSFAPQLDAALQALVTELLL